MTIHNQNVCPDVIEGWFNAFEPTIGVACAWCSGERACDAETEEAEVSCKQSNGCEACTDFHFGDDCAANGQEHCAEISCCPACESEIRAMFACEHGEACGTELTCGVACEEDTCPYDTTDDGMVGVDDLLGLLAAYGREC